VSAGRTVYAGGNERGDAFGDARRRKHWSECNERSAQRGARVERVGAFRLLAVAVHSVAAEAFRLLAVAIVAVLSEALTLSAVAV
jgi:hypothetical protein